MNFLKRLFLKVLFFPLTRMIIAIVAIVVVLVFEGVLQQWIGRSYGVNRTIWFRVMSGTIVIASTCLIYCGYVRLFERRPTVELSRERSLREFASGSAVGFGVIAMTIASLWLGGYYRVQGIGLLPSAAVLVGLGLVPAFVEEIIVRGIIFRITEESLGTWLAIVISGLFFGFSHMLNPGATWLAAVCIAVEAGLLLAAAYITTRRLWFAIGMHFAWNFTLGGIFGGIVSGQAVRGLLKSTLTGPELLSGGEFGAESSIFAVVVCTSMAIFLLVRAVRNDRIIRPFWSRRTTEPITVAADKPNWPSDEIQQSPSAAS
jgi:uncharacterized protein